jgi:hypothetical protein
MKLISVTSEYSVPTSEEKHAISFIRLNLLMVLMEIIAACSYTKHVNEHGEQSAPFANVEICSI